VDRIAHLNLSECCRTLDDLDLQRRLGCWPAGLRRDQHIAPWSL